MASTVEILFVGLCSFLNMENKVNYMPPPSVVMHRVDPATNHVTFIAWKESETTLDNAANLPVMRTRNQTPFIMVDAEEISLNNDLSELPTLDATFKDHVARLTKYANLAATPLFDQTRVPLPGRMPSPKVEQAYLEFGKGTVSSDWPTSRTFVFRDDELNAADETARTYDRRVLYTYPTAADALAIVLRKFDNSTHRRLVFRPAAGTTVRVWIGNSTDIDEDMSETPKITNDFAEHFRFFYDTLALPPATQYIPVAEDGTTTSKEARARRQSAAKNSHTRHSARADATQLDDPPAGGSGTGYCGPDNQP
jgi:hypothetical protein